MGCPSSLATLQNIDRNIEAIKQLVQNNPIQPKTPASILYDGLCSTIGTTAKGLLEDDAGLPPASQFTRMTLKVRDMGTNSYIAFGASPTPSFRFTAILQAYTFETPISNGSSMPFLGESINVLGDGSNGVVEITGFRIEEGAV